MIRNARTQQPGHWYRIREIKKNLFEVHEPEHVSFYILKYDNKAVLIDSGLGLDHKEAKKLFKSLGIKEYCVMNTHLHCDHVGLNYRAKKVFAYKKEWAKYSKNKESKHTSIYYELLKDILPWPKHFWLKPQHRKFKPTHFIKLSKHYDFGPWRLKPIYVPGHTTGSLCFMEENSNVLLLGDFFYNGILYINLEDSSITQFEKSLNKIAALIRSKKKNPLLLPCHNDIPLDVRYIKRLETLLKRIKEGKQKPRGRWPFGRFFLPSRIFVYRDVRILIRKDQLMKWKTS
ncbi:MAG: MBL fold metallo-hydrolase [bacterium]|nr:MBL fold metallo-hydrolase [bacterium]MBU1917588.1 MBL fold metallo-hydrolase [bacterium]